MAIQFPTNLDTLTNPVASDNTVTVPHATQHADANDAIEALEAKVGKDSSAVTTSHDYKLSSVTGTKKAVPDTDGTLTTPAINVGSDATGDILYRHSDGKLKRLAIGADGKILKVASGVPAWDTETVTADASTTAKGVVEEATLAEIDANTATGGTSARLFVNPSTLGKSTDGTMADNSDAKIPSQKAVKTYADTVGAKYASNGTTTQYTSAAEVSATSTISKTFSVLIPGLITVQFDGKVSIDDGTDSYTITLSDFNNVKPTINSTTTPAFYLDTSYTTFSIQLFLTPGRYTLTVNNNNARTVYLRNLYLKFDVSAIGTTYVI